MREHAACDAAAEDAAHDRHERRQDPHAGVGRRLGRHAQHGGDQRFGRHPGGERERPPQPLPGPRVTQHRCAEQHAQHRGLDVVATQIRDGEPDAPERPEQPRPRGLPFGPEVRGTRHQPRGFRGTQMRSDDAHDVPSDDASCPLRGEAGPHGPSVEGGRDAVRVWRDGTLGPSVQRSGPARVIGPPTPAVERHSRAAFGRARAAPGRRSSGLVFRSASKPRESCILQCNGATGRFDIPEEGERTACTGEGPGRGERKVWNVLGEPDSVTD